MEVGFRCVEGGQNYQEALEQVELAETVGFDSVWLAEHHGWSEFWPSSYIALTAFAARTTDIRIGTNILLLPEKNPVRLAGEANLIDVISEGRFTLGVGVGWRKTEMENLGYSFSDRGPRMTDHLRAMNTLWNKSPASYDGRDVSFSGFELSPDPVQTPHPPVWVGGKADPALKRAAYLGSAWIPVWMPSMSELRERYRKYHEYVREAGEDPDQRERPLLRLAYIDEDIDAARSNLRELVKNMIEGYGDQGSAPFSDEAIQLARDDFEAFAEERFIYGDAEKCISDIREYRDELGIDHLILKLHNPGIEPEKVTSFVERFGTDVLPYVE